MLDRDYFMNERDYLINRMIINFIIIYIKVMNKFSKTSYSRPSTHNRNPNYNNFLQSSQDKREKLYSR